MSKKSKKKLIFLKKRDLKKMTYFGTSHPKMVRLSSNLDRMHLIGFKNFSKRGFWIFAFFSENLHILTKKRHFLCQNGIFYAKNAKIHSLKFLEIL